MHGTPTSTLPDVMQRCDHCAVRHQAVCGAMDDVQVKKLAEESKITIRNERRDANKAVDALATDKKAGVTEDMAKSAKEDIDDFTKKHTAKLDELADKKVAEIEEV